jgi:hypothetical protein
MAHRRRSSWGLAIFASINLGMVETEGIVIDSAEKAKYGTHA